MFMPGKLGAVTYISIERATASLIASNFMHIICGDGEDRLK
jgi:hypothetical protein